MELLSTKNFFHEYSDKMWYIQEIILEYLEKSENQEVIFQNFIKYLEDQKILEDQYDTLEILNILLKISNNHHRTMNFFSKIERILKLFQTTLQKFSNYSIFNIFKSNKRILLFLFEEKILIPDQSIYKIITKRKYISMNYPKYFFIEFKPFFNTEKVQELDSKIIQNDLELFKQKRKIGENDSYLCSLIQKDSIDEFVTFSTKTNLKFSTTTIENSIYETNSFLLKNKRSTLIEYAAFFGSIQIFKFLRMNGVKLTSSLWLYAIHSNSAELIHILEENHVEMEDKSYQQYFIEAIKCHHIDISNYIKNNFLNEKFKFELNCLKYYNFNDLKDKDINLMEPEIFYYLLKYNYVSVVDFLLNNIEINVNDLLVVSNSNFFDMISKSIFFNENIFKFIYLNAIINKNFV